MTPPDQLRPLLRRWQHEPAPAPEFARGVWARIHAARQDERVVVAFRWALPIAASLALFLGASAARMQAQRAHAEQMADFYVRTVDPVQMADHGSHK
ncbi:hypothetical protein [Oleiharenicola sp. Vm1]|uniref:hypothetical protein n=1 Tax=Oleiharenicola sp. Vm1 TaxID=3398393 RepID=UPI0039F4EF2A